MVLPDLDSRVLDASLSRTEGLFGASSDLLVVYWNQLREPVDDDVEEVVEPEDDEGSPSAPVEKASVWETVAVKDKENKRQR